MLFIPTTDTVRLTEHWHVVKDGDAVARALHHEHYSKYRYKDGRQPALFVGPGEKIVLVNAEGSAFFAWRFFDDDWLKHRALWCCAFRNTSEVRSSDLLLEAERVAECRWPGEPMYTWVDPSQVKSVNPGYCFKVCGWKKIGESAKGKHCLKKDQAERDRQRGIG